MTSRKTTSRECSCAAPIGHLLWQTARKPSLKSMMVHPKQARGTYPLCSPTPASPKQRTIMIAPRCLLSTPILGSQGQSTRGRVMHPLSSPGSPRQKTTTTVLPCRRTSQTRDLRGQTISTIANRARGIYLPSSRTPDTKRRTIPIPNWPRRTTVPLRTFSQSGIPLAGGAAMAPPPTNRKCLTTKVP